jgi:hypothetical protein
VRKLCQFLDAVFQYDPGFQEDPSQPFSDSDDEVNDTDGKLLVYLIESFGFNLFEWLSSSKTEIDTYSYIWIIWVINTQILWGSWDGI